MGSEMCIRDRSEMLRIGETINEIERMMAAIVQESTKQREALDQVEEATNNLERIGEANAVAAEEITASMLQLSRIASNAKSSIDEFSLGQSEHDDELPTDDSETGNESDDEIVNADGVQNDQ